MIVDVGQIIALLIAAAGLFLSAGQVRMQRREQRMGQIVHLYERLYDDPAIQAMYRRLERGLGYPLHPTASVRRRNTTGWRSNSTGCWVCYRSRRASTRCAWSRPTTSTPSPTSTFTVHQDPDVQAYLDAVEASNRARGMDIEPVKAFREVGDLLQRKHHYRPVPREWRRDGG